jgi:acylphosphatase
MADLQTRRYVISGRVQGVGFRWFVEREAVQIGIAGWVRNRDNGEVEVMATGTREQHSALRARLQEGPRAARVDQVHESSAPELETQSFRIEGAW